MGGNVKFIDKDDIWEKLDNSRAYYDGYRCRKCGTVIVVEDYLDLPCYCKECEKRSDTK